MAALSPPSSLGRFEKAGQMGAAKLVVFASRRPLHTKFLGVLIVDRLFQVCVFPRKYPLRLQVRASSQSEVLESFTNTTQIFCESKCVDAELCTILFAYGRVLGGIIGQSRKYKWLSWMDETLITQCFQMISTMQVHFSQERSSDIE